MPFVVRPIRADDEPLLLAMHGNLSVENLRPPCLGAVKVLSRDSLVRLCRLDSAQDAGFVAEEKDAGGASHLLGVSRYFFDSETNSAEVALEVIKPWQSQGLSARLIKPLIAVARQRGIRRLITGAQAPMISIATTFGFLMNMESVDASDGRVKVVRDLERGIDLSKYDPSSISKADVKFLVSPADKWPGDKEEIMDFFLQVDSAYATQCLDELVNDPDPQIKSNAVELLVFRLGPKSLPWIEKCLNDDDVDFRCAGCGFLAELDCPEAVPRLLRCLQEDPSDQVRYAAVEALESHADMSAIPALRQTVKNDRGTDFEGRPIRDRAREAIRQITEQNR
jgi:GNAT superfamily N-acetyltransferase